jgi:hypothetical protein
LDGKSRGTLNGNLPGVCQVLIFHKKEVKFIPCYKALFNGEPCPVWSVTGEEGCDGTPWHETSQCAGKEFSDGRDADYLMLLFLLDVKQMLIEQGRRYRMSKLKTSKLKACPLCGGKGKENWGITIGGLKYVNCSRGDCLLFKEAISPHIWQALPRRMKCKVELNRINGTHWCWAWWLEPLKMPPMECGHFYKTKTSCLRALHKWTDKYGFDLEDSK